ncbi:MAG: SusD/RagB family nutrient-binding outer membrane lipoprotein [Bacteroidetes bacterium]|nr:SusD/RagB family nutrient-binding outer membrane lipoprotein [Bacteroidota bacterium]
MKLVKYISIASLISGLLMLSSCSDFLDINVDPNNPTDSPVTLLLPSAEVSLGGYLGFATTGLGFVPSAYVHYLSPRRSGLTDYSVTGTNFEIEVPWAGFYTATLPDLEQVIAKGEEDGNLIYAGIGKILKAYTFSIMVDVWGDVPFSDASQGTDVLFPNFDKGEDIYPALISLINDGIANLSDGSGLRPGADDIFYNGDTGKWIRFANTLKLKMYNQVRMVQNVESEVAALINDDNMIGPGDDFELPYGTNQSPLDQNPAFNNEYSGGPSYVSIFLYEMLTGKSSDNPIYSGISDPRLPYYFYNQLANGAAAQNPTAYRDGDFVSIYMFSFNIDPNEGFDQAQSKTVVGLYPVGGKYDDGSGQIVTLNSGAGNVAQRLLPYFSHLYIRAELAVTGVTNENARDLFESGVQASFDKVNAIAANASAPRIDQTEIDAYIAEVLSRYDAADAAGKLEHIMTQKWLASFGFAIDPYTDYRRTGYPVLFDGNLDTNPNTKRGREYPVSLPYSASNLNVNPNAPSQRVIANDKVFWDN